MKRLARIAVTASLMGGLAVIVEAPPASAAIATSVAGGTLTVTVTGDQSFGFLCDGGSVRVGNTFVSPTMACSALTLAKVNGDGATQLVDGSSLNVPAFTGNPSLEVSLGAGTDTVIDTKRADKLDLGADDDSLTLETGGVANTTNALGAGEFDVLTVQGTTGADEITVTSATTSATFLIEPPTGAPVSQTATGMEDVYVRGLAGDDEINADAVAITSNINNLALDGATGHNILRSTTHAASFYDIGGTATMTGSPQTDSFWMASEADTANGGGGSDFTYDYSSLRSGNRTINGPPDSVNAISYLYGYDTTARVRPGSVGQATLVSSLNRPGIANLNAPVSQVSVGFYYSNAKPSLNLYDTVAFTKRQQLIGDKDDNDLVDITVPTGTWVQSGDLATDALIDPSEPSYGNIYLKNVGALNIHGPWGTSSTGRAKGFVHRVTRDLVFRFLSGSARDALAAQLTGGGTTRAMIVKNLINTDEYRGLDVDRVFRRFLKREADPGGRTYWINAIRGGRSLRVFRAQLFGSNEYFTKAGSTNTGFVTSAYRDVLGRIPDPSGLAYWVRQIEVHGMSRATVANNFLGSTEARRAIIKDQYLRFLGRFPIDSEVEAWLEPLRVGATGEQDLVAFLAGSAAYHARD